MLRQLLPEFDEVILTQFTSNPRGMPVAELTALAQDACQALSLSTLPLHPASGPRVAWEKWQSLATPDSLLCIAGSFFLAAELTPMLPRSQHPAVPQLIP
jgi:dihydrofolate synthase/folylpolyglutamate synthase